MKNKHNCSWCNSTRILKINKPIAKYKGNIYYYYFCKNCEIKFAYCKNEKVKINYDKIQDNHTGYKIHIADNKWVKSLFDADNNSYSINQIYNFLATKTMDQRYLSALDIAYKAFLEGKKLDILEVGCNLGYIGAFFIKLNHNYIGIDVQENAIKKAKKNYGSKYFFNIPFEKFNKRFNKKYDLICSFEVIEHLQNPFEFIDFATINLKKSGEIILSTPNGNFIPRDEWYSEFPPIHFSLFKEKTFKILRKKNYEVKFFNKYQFGFNIHFLIKLILFKIVKVKQLIKNENKLLIPSTDPYDKNFIYSYKKTKLEQKKKYMLIRIVSFINLFASIIFSLFNIAPLAGQIFVSIKKKD